MLLLMDKAAIIKLQEKGESNRRIAKVLDMSRSTVNKYIQQYELDKRKLQEVADPVEMAVIQQRMLSRNNMDVSSRRKRKFNGEIADEFHKIVRLNDERNRKLGSNKQEISSAIIYRELLRKGFEVKESTVRGW